MSLLKRAVFSVIWGICFGLVLGVIDCVRIGFLYYQGGFLSPYLIDCISIFALATARIIFFAALASLCTVLFLYYAHTRSFQNAFQDLPPCGSLLFLVYALLVLLIHPEPIWTTRLHAVLYIFLLLAVSLFIWAILKGLTGFAFIGTANEGRYPERDHH